MHRCWVRQQQSQCQRHAFCSQPRLGASETIRQVDVLVPKPNDLGLISSPHIVKEGTNFYKLFLEYALSSSPPKKTLAFIMSLILSSWLLLKKKKVSFHDPIWGHRHSSRSYCSDCRVDFSWRVEHFFSRLHVGSWATQVEVSMRPQGDSTIAMLGPSFFCFFVFDFFFCIFVCFSCCCSHHKIPWQIANWRGRGGFFQLTISSYSPPLWGKAAGTWNSSPHHIHNQEQRGITPQYSLACAWLDGSARILSRNPCLGLGATYSGLDHIS